MIVNLVSCKKDKTPVNVAATLEGHSWYSYKTDISIHDTLTVTLYDSNHVQTSSKTTTRNLDTTIITEGCLKNTYYQFNANGTLSISSPCNISNNSLNTTWIYAQSKILNFSAVNNPSVQNYIAEHNYFNFPTDDTYSIYPSGGYLTNINSSQLIVTGYLKGFFDVYRVYGDSSYKEQSKVITEFRSK